MIDLKTNSVQNYKRYGISIVEVAKDTIVIKQERLLNGYILNQKQLLERAKEIFPDKRIKPVVFSFDVKSVSIEWIEDRMKTFGIKRNDLIKQLAIEKAFLNLLFAKKIDLPNNIKALFYYYFLTYEINFDIRNR